MTRDQISSLPSIYRLLKWNIKQRLGADSIRTRTPFGFKMDLAFIDQSATHIFFQHYETEEADTLMKLIKPGMTVLDIGANIGYFTLLMAKQVTSSGSVFAFEPNPRMIEQLEKNIALNTEVQDGRIRIEKIALGCEEADTDFYAPVRGAEGVGGLRDTKRAPVDQTLRVHVSKLDRWITLKDVARIDLIKIDVEGGELDVFRGAEDVLRKFRPILLFEAVEINTKPYGYAVRELLDFLRRFEYDIQPMSCGYNYLAMPRN